MKQRFDIRPADVFVSFTGADREIKNKIVSYLESRNITCLDADKDCSGDYRQWSIEAPNHCSLFLPIITENVKETSIMKDEYDAMKRTYESLKEQDKDDFFNRIVPVSTNLKVYQEHSFGMDENVSAVLDEKLPEDIEEGVLEKIWLNVKRLLIHIDCRKKYNPGRASEFFRGRETEIEKLREKLNSFNTVFICGIGGIGKTELAKKYADYQREFKGAFFNVIYLKYREYAEGEDKSPLESIISSVTEGMSIADKKEVFNNPETLVILDNFDVQDDSYLNEFLSFNCKKIITTRNKSFSNYENASVFEVGALPEESQQELFEAHYGYKVDKNDENLRFILDAVAGVTIFIPIIAKQCLSAKIDLKDMCERLKDGGIASLKDSEKLTAYKDEALLRGNTLEIARIIFKIADLDEKCKKALRNLSLIQFMRVNAQLYKEICTEGDNGGIEQLNKLVENCWVIENKDAVSPKNNSFELHPIIKELVKNDLKPSVENCPEVWKYAESLSQADKEDVFKRNSDFELLVKLGLRAIKNPQNREHRSDEEFSWARLGLWRAFLKEVDFENEVNYNYIVRKEKERDRSKSRAFLRVWEFLSTYGFDELISSLDMIFLSGRIKKILLEKETFSGDDVFMSAMLLGVKSIAEDVITVEKLAEKCLASRKKTKKAVLRRFAEKLVYAASKIMEEADSRNDQEYTVYVSLLKKFRKYLSFGMKWALKGKLRRADAFLAEREYYYAERSLLAEKVNKASTLEEALQITYSLWRRLDRVYFFTKVIFPKFLREDMTPYEAEETVKAFAEFYRDDPLCDPEYNLDESHELRDAFVISYTGRGLTSLSYDAVYNFLVDMRSDKSRASLTAAGICNDREKGEKAIREYLYKKPVTEKTDMDFTLERFDFPGTYVGRGTFFGFDAYAELLFDYTDEIKRALGSDKEFEKSILMWYTELETMFKEEANRQRAVAEKRNYELESVNAKRSVPLHP